MFSKKHIPFLTICLITVLLLCGCRDTVDYSSTPVIPGGNVSTQSDNTSGTSSADSLASESDTSSNVSSSNTASSSKPINSAKPNVSGNVSSNPSNYTSSQDLSKPADSTNSNFSSTASHLHTYKKITVEPTCTEDGKTFYECVECGAKKDEITIKSAGHIWGEWKTEKEATLLNKGLKERECTVCHQKETEQIPLLEPNYSALRTELLNLVNNERTNKLEYSTEMQTEADKRVEELAESFVSKNEEGYAENIYKGTLSENGELTAQEAFSYWFNSENQKDKNNILSEEFTHTAIGVLLKDGECYWVQIFSK